MTVFNLFSMPTATASGSLSGSYDASKAFDGSSATYWLTSAATSGSPQWLQVYCARAIAVDAYSLLGHPGSTIYNPKDWVLQGSNDGSTWDDLHTVTGATWASTSTTNSYTFTNTTAYNYYRLHITATNGATDYVGIAECSLISIVGSASSSSAATGFPARDAFDGSTSTRWMAPAAATSGSPQWLKRTPEAPLAVNAYQLRGHPSSTIYNPTAWKVQGSNNDSDWTDLDTRSGVTWSGTTEVKEYTFANTTEYAHYRLHVTAVNGATDFTAVSEWAGDYAGASGGITGTLDVTDHADTVTISGTVTAATVTGILSVTDHADTATISGAVAGVGGAVTGTFQVVDHADTATIEGMVVSELDDIDTRPVRVRVAPRLHSVPVPAPIPAALASNVKPVARYSHVAPAITAANAPLTEGVDYPFATQVSVGYERLFVDDIDVTYWRDTPVIISRLSSSTPLGYSAASIEVPAMHPWEEPGAGECAWMRPDAPVKAALVDENDEIVVNLWSGFISKDSADLGQGRKSNGFTCDGIMWQAGYAQHEPPHYMPPTDIGTVIPDLLNSVPGKRYGDIPRVVTGIPTRTRGSSQQKIGQIVNEILQKEGWTVDGRQWTIEEVAPDEYRMVLKAPASTVHATVTYGVQGVEVSLERDQASRIDLIYGVGNAPNGGQWRGTRFPGLVLAQPPEYPNTDASSMHLGDTDADTDSGTGISDMQRRLVEMGYSLTVDGVLNANDIDVIRRLQGRMGLLVDGVPGPQTWSGIFNRGPEGIDLTQWREPLAALSWTQEHFRDPNGIILSDNPEYADTAKVQHPVEIHYGENITWTQAQPLADKLLNVESTPALTGQIVLLTDPHEVSRRHLKAGQNIKVVGFQGRDVVLRIARMDMEADGRVILAVDERGRDALTVDQIRTRNLAAMADPVRRPGNPNRESRISRDRYVQWDIDSPCGFMPRTAVYGGLWVAPNPIPFAEVGRVVKTMLTCTVPFTLALFGLPVKPSQMHSIVGDPHTQDRPWEGEARVAALDALGWIISWGSQGERCGFSPNGQESSGAAFTGKFEEYGGFDFISGRPPYVWPLLFASTTGFIGGAEAGGWGRFYPDTSV